MTSACFNARRPGDTERVNWSSRRGEANVANAACWRRSKRRYSHQSSAPAANPAISQIGSANFIVSPRLFFRVRSWQPAEPCLCQADAHAEQAQRGQERPREQLALALEFLQCVCGFFEPIDLGVDVLE